MVEIVSGGKRVGLSRSIDTERQQRQTGSR
jgi:hypothetical protein